MRWGNEGFTADIDFLEELVRRAQLTPGPVLECGSGLTTILLGLLVGRRGIEVWTLEHDREWHARVARVLKQRRIAGINLCIAPLRDYGGFSWYDPPLKRMPKQFCLVVCDGPPGATPGGRYGLLPIMGEYLGSGCVILLDDAGPWATETLHRWTTEAPMIVDLLHMPGGSLAIVSRC